MNLKDLEILCDLPAGEYAPAEVGGVRTKTVRAGASLEVSCYPICRVTPAARAEAARRRSTPAMARLNRERAARRIRQLIEANFTRRSLVITLTWDYGIALEADRMSRSQLRAAWEAEGLPLEEDDARRALRNFFARIRYRMAEAERLKYLYVLESTHEPRDTDPDPLPARYHFHLVLDAPGLTREAVKALWPHGSVRADELDLRGEGAARLAGYFTKGKSVERVDGSGRRLRRWACSRNLKEPDTRVSDRTVSRRRAALVARDVMGDGREIFEKLYPGYRVVDGPTVKFSDFVPGAYIYARLRKRE